MALVLRKLELVFEARLFFQLAAEQSALDEDAVDCLPATEQVHPAVVPVSRAARLLN